ncbi:unnamed protein product [Mesocestoides corti]|uniref:Exocyst complex component n=2 Tax=Mesocestoides corti TaxID=53468 RepID=A0A0R3U6G1_MESCO|nr:unnamed protein product [Mesocestoides corti]
MADFAIESIDFSPLLDELESGSSGSCANVIRKLREYEVAAYEAGQGGPTGELIASFIARLDERVADRELDIEKTCSHNYESFVESVQELVLVQEKAEQLQRNLREIRSNIETSVQRLNDSSEALATNHATLNRIDQCIAALRISLPVLDQYEKVEKSIADGRYYHALKTLEHLEHYQLKSIQSYSFSQLLSKRIPELRSEIKAASLAQLTDFLEEIRKHSTRLGAIAMRQTAEKTGMSEDAIVDAGSSEQRNEITTFRERTSSDCDEPDIAVPPPPPIRRKHIVPESSYTNALEAELEELALAAKRFENESGGGNSPDTKNNIEALINFGPIYRCLHIHSVSGERSEFEQYYFTQRRKQCQLILSLSPSQQSSLRNYSEFFSRVVGFFLVDDYLRHTMPGAASYYQSYLSDLWTTVVPRLTQLVSRNASDCKTTSELLSLKHYCVLFERTMANLGFNTTGLNEMLEAIRKQFSQLLIARWRDQFNEILKTDNYTAITLEKASEMSPLLASYPYCQTPEFTSQPFPRTLAFSPMVPSVYAAIRDYIDASAQFIVAPSVGLAWTELEDALNRATNVLFTDCLSDLLDKTIQAAEANLLRLIQLTINLSELESACEHLQSYLHEKARPKFFSSPSLVTSLNAKCQSVNIDEDGDCEDGSDVFALMAAQPDDVQPSRSHLYGVSLFRDCRARTETQIYTNLNSRVDEFCSLASYDGIFGGPGEGTASLDYLVDTPPALTAIKPSEYMTDMMAWLGSTFAAFTHLPPKVAHTACFSVCKHIVKLLQRILMGPDVKMVSEPALTHILVDLAECDKFARSDPVPGIDKSILLLIFHELRQLLELVRKDDWKVYFANYGKPTGNPYDRVTPAAAVSLLECIREAEKKKSSFIGSMKKVEREKRKRLEDLIKQLKDLQSGSAAYGTRRA